MKLTEALAYAADEGKFVTNGDKRVTLFLQPATKYDENMLRTVPFSQREHLRAVLGTPTPPIIYDVSPQGLRVFEPTTADLFRTDWVLTDSLKRSDDRPANMGVIEVDDALYPQLELVMNGWGYGEILAAVPMKNGMYQVTIRSSLFERVPSGKQTPFYMLKIDVDARLVTAHKVV